MRGRKFLVQRNFLLLDYKICYNTKKKGIFNSWLQKKGLQRTYKDRVFCDLFSKKEHALSLYNALNGTAYSDIENLKIVTLSDSIYMTMKNDVAVCFHDCLDLWEQQSTLNPNMPLRGLMYFGKSYSAWLSVNNMDIYSSQLIKIPAPEYYVLYNGTAEVDDETELKLSDAFVKPSPGYEWTAHMININSGKNSELMSKCPTLFGYPEFVGEIRTNQASGFNIEEAVEKAVDDCIEKDILKEYLTKHKAEVRDMIITEYNERLHEQTLRDEGRQEGIQEGLEVGEKRMASLILRLVQDKQYDAMAKASSDKAYRDSLFAKYGL